MRIRPLEQVVREKPEFKPGWKERRDGDITSELSSKFGKVERVYVQIDENKGYDQWQYVEANARNSGKGPATTGAVTVPYYVKKTDGLVYLGLVTQVRPVVINGETGEQGNMSSTEFPRGFANTGEKGIDTAIREGGEETGKHFKSAKRIGSAVPNTTFFAAGAEEYSAEFDPEIQGSLRPDANEQILKMNYIALPDLLMMMRENPSKIYCGLTKSALIDFIASLPPEVMLRQMQELYGLEKEQEKKS